MWLIEIFDLFLQYIFCIEEEEKKIPFLSFIRNIFNGLSRVLASKLHLHIFNLAEEKKSVSSFIIAKFYFHITYAERKDLFTFIKTLSILRKFKSNRLFFDGAKNFAFLTEISYSLLQVFAMWTLIVLNNYKVDI